MSISISTIFIIVFVCFYTFRCLQVYHQCWWLMTWLISLLKNYMIWYVCFFNRVIGFKPISYLIGEGVLSREWVQINQVSFRYLIWLYLNQSDVFLFGRGFDHVSEFKPIRYVIGEEFYHVIRFKPMWCLMGVQYDCI